MAMEHSMPFRSHFVEMMGTALHYIDEGDGPPVLFLHGSPTSSYIWRNIIPQVVPLGRCIALDLVGMGRSGKPPISYRIADHAQYLEMFIESLGLERLVLVMHGWGSALGFDYARRFERNVSGLAFMEPIRSFKIWDDFPSLAVETFRRFRHPVAGRELVIEQNVFIENVLPKTMLRSLDDGEMDQYRLPFLKPEDREPLYRFANEVPVEGEPADVSEMMRLAEEWLETSSLPKLLLHASPGANVTPADAEHIRLRLQNISVVNVGKGLHLIQEDCPDEIGKALASWISQRLSRS